MMSPKFAAVVDPLLEKLIDTLEQLQAGRLRFAEVRERCLQAFEAADDVLGADRDWERGRYAIVAWVDSELIAIDETWKDRTLEAQYYRRTEAHVLFFQMAQIALNEKLFDACECYLLCFLFGFRGVYDRNDPSYLDASWPPTAEEWQRQMAGFVRSGRARQARPIQWAGTSARYPDAEELSGGSFLKSAALLFGLSIFALILYYFLFMRGG